MEQKDIVRDLSEIIHREAPEAEANI